MLELFERLNFLVVMWKKPVTIKLLVEKVSFHQSTKSLRILGTILEGHLEEYVPRGKHHSIEISLHDELLIIKDKWLKMDLDLLYEAKEVSRKPKVGVLILDNELASYFLLYPYGLEKWQMYLLNCLENTL